MMVWVKRISLLILTLAVFIVGVTYLFWMPSPQEAPYQLVKTGGGKGEKPGQFNEPTGIALAGNEIFVSDSRNTRIQVFDLDGNFKRMFGEQGDAPGQLNRPMNLTIAGDELYVAEFFNDRIQVYGLDGKFRRSIGKAGSAGGEMSAPGGLAVNADGELFVADFFNQRVQQLTADGRFIRQWGTTKKTGVLDGRLNYPTDVAINSEGVLYIADGYNDRILAFGPDGELLHRWGGPFAMNIFGPFNSWFATVTGISIGPRGDVFVADFYNDRVQKFSAEGEFINAFGIESTAPTHTAIAVVEADDGSVFVADYANHQVQKWQPGE